MKRSLPNDPPPSLIAYELEPGRVMFVETMPTVPHIPGLSDAEQEVLVMLLGGYDTEAISDSRGTSPRTIANQVASIFKKLGVGSRAELAAKILEMTGN